MVGSIGRPNQRPLIGRGKEIARLQDLMQITEQAQQSRLRQKKMPSPPTLSSDTQPQRPHCVLLSGKRGTGLTRLAEEAAREANLHNWGVVWCRAYQQEGNIPYLPWIEALRNAKEKLWQAQTVAQRPLVYRPLRHLLPELQDLLPQTGPAGPTLPGGEQLFLWEAIRILLNSMCERTSLLIVFDDPHWADERRSSLVVFLVREMSSQEVIFLCTCRETILPTWHTDLQRERLAEVLQVSRMSDQELHALLAGQPTPLAESIIDQASGLPFYAEELARATGGEPFPETIPLEHDLPATVKAAFTEMLSPLSFTCRQMLDLASLWGAAFTAKNVERLARQSVAQDLLRKDGLTTAIEEALGQGVLEEVIQEGQIFYLFLPSLLASYLYHQISTSRRERWHRAMEEEEWSEDAGLPRCAFCPGGLSPLALPEAADVAMPDDLALTYRCQQCHQVYEIQYRRINIVALTAEGNPKALIRYCLQCRGLYRDGDAHSC